MELKSFPSYFAPPNTCETSSMCVWHLQITGDGDRNFVQDVEGNALRAYGAGLMSSHAETLHALTSEEPRRLRFDLPRLMRTEWPFDTFQPTYFVIESFAALLEEMETTSLKDVYDEVRDLPLIPIGEPAPSDQPYDIAPA